MIFKREKKVMPITHWEFGLIPRLRTYCGITLSRSMSGTIDKCKVNCLRCKSLMRLHGHLPEEESEYER